MTPDVFKWQSVDTLSVGEHSVPVEKWDGTNIKPKPKNARVRDIFLNGTIELPLLQAFAASLKDGSLPEDEFSPEQLMDLWILSEALGHHTIRDDIEHRLVLM